MLYGYPLTRSRGRTANYALSRGLPAIAASTFFGADRAARKSDTVSSMGGSSGSHGQRYLTSKSKKKKSNLKQKIINYKQAKHQAASDLCNMLHSSIFVKSLTTLITQGDTISNRDGDEIYLEALKYAINIQAPATANGYSYRFMVILHDNEVTANWATGGLAVADLFLPGTEANWGANAIPNSKAVTVLHDEVLDINSQVAGAIDCYSIKGTVQLNRLFPYKASGSTWGKFKNLYMVLIGCSCAGTAGVTATGTAVVAYDLIFKNV